MAEVAPRMTIFFMALSFMVAAGVAAGRVVVE
jgi:hypothetical protein